MNNEGNNKSDFIEKSPIPSGSIPSELIPSGSISENKIRDKKRLPSINRKI